MACITKRRGRYVIDCYDQNGKRYRKTLPLGTNKDQARKELREIEGKIERRTFAHEKKIPTFGGAGKEWLEYKKPNVRETTWEMYDGHLRNHFSSIKDSRIDMITTATVEKWISKRQTEGMCLGMLRRLLTTFTQIMAYAVRHGYIGANPVRDAERPRRKIDDTDNGNVAVLNPGQIRALLEATESQIYRTLFLTAIMTGARQGEILALKWSDVDFEKKQIHIRRTFNHDRYFTPKTKASFRSIDLAPSMVLELKKWKLANARNELDLVFATREGKRPLQPGPMTLRYFRPALKTAGLPMIRFHDLRHTYASIMIEQGESIKYVSSQLGHSSVTITLNIYSHLIKNENQEAALRLENTIFNVTGHKMVTNGEKGPMVNR